MSTGSIISSPTSLQYDEPAKEREGMIDPIGRLVTSGDQGEYVHIGGKRYLRSDLAYAFGGTFTTGVTGQSHLRIGNASPLGLFAHSTTVFMMSLINSRARGLTNDSIMLGSALFYGGVVQILAGFWELALKNTFAGTVFASYGGFWMSYSVITMGGFNIKDSYESQKDYQNAMGIFMLMWAIISSMFTICTIRGTVPMFGQLFTTTLSDALSAASYFAYSIQKDTAAKRCSQASGIVGCVIGFLALYNAMAGLLDNENSFVIIKPWYMPGAIRPNSKSKEA